METIPVTESPNATGQQVVVEKPIGLETRLSPEVEANLLFLGLSPEQAQGLSASDLATMAYVKECQSGLLLGS